MIPALVLSCFMQGAAAPVVINEFVYDDSGTDDREFVELYNRSKASVNIGSWKLEAANLSSANASYTIPASTILAAGAYYVIGPKARIGGTPTVPNTNLYVGTATTTSGATDLWGNGPNTLTLKTGTGAVMDHLMYEVVLGRISATNPPGDAIWGTFIGIDGIETSLSRPRDGVTVGRGRDFLLRPSTPGKSNNIAPLPVYLQTFDAGTTDAALPKWGGSFVKPFYVDPTKVGKGNPNPIAASPQGGKAAAFWDPAGGGNSNVLLADTRGDIVVEAWVYFDAQGPSASATGALQYQTWSLGVQGGTHTYFNTPNVDPAGSGFAFTYNGNTGVSWTYQSITKTSGLTKTTTGVLYLVDHGDGGWWKASDPPRAPKTEVRILGKISIVAGTNDGWQRLRLEVHGDIVEGYFGGKMGCADGTRVAGKLSMPAEGGVYVGYRERVDANATARPFTCDFLQIRAPSSKIAYFGTAAKSTKGTPNIEALAAPTIGNKGFTVAATGLVPGSVSLWFVDLTSLGSPPALPLAGLGGVAGSFLYANPTITQPLGNSSTGTASFGPIVVPCQTGLVGTIIHGQILDLDPALIATNALPFGTSRRLTLTIGQ